ncbi:DNA-processing protein DprA [Rhodovulum euryhalinum]|uniref:DNA protecting protein DprA n=1 Tax=Rhodovulum euryhalinum TaxID=35805 RepID=A0A4R2KPX3_9RHOB|nr:DNA-processing protein DprA [Rhodovulum euryhalinum]TCO72926.1 DNA protecting protein DprA [Rhodovulum euryhalinum]
MPTLAADSPRTAPLAEAELVARLRLIRSRRVGATTFFRLIDEHGSAEAALDALPGVARAAGVDGYEACPEGVARAELSKARALGAVPLVHGTSGYPEALAELPDAPPVLWAVGRTDLLNRPMVALVGARNASSLGVRMARKLAEGLAEAGHVVVSGLARGIDRAAHLAALDTGTIAVMAGGVNVVYPTENESLFNAIGGQGLRLSEHPAGLQPQARHFPQRNRIISGLARAVVVVEAAARSGSLITARTALDQGRDVLAVPGHPFDARAAGCNMLLRDGATLVRGVEDVLDALAAPPAPPLTRAAAAEAPRRPRITEVPDTPAHARRPVAADCAVLHAEILSRLGPSPLAEDQLIRDLNLPAGHVAPELLMLELEGRIARAPGGLISRMD